MCALMCAALLWGRRGPDFPIATNYILYRSVSHKIPNAQSAPSINVCEEKPIGRVLEVHGYLRTRSKLGSGSTCGTESMVLRVWLRPHSRTLNLGHTDRRAHSRSNS